jgi:cupin fold WbuC family metalloprotein
MNNIKEIKYKKKLYALLISYENKKGLNFFTNQNLSQQVAFMKYDSKKIIEPHFHNKFTRIINNTSEVLIILKGVLKVNLYNSKKKIFKNFLVKKKQILILISGGHGFEIIKPIEMIEVKQGPYKKYKDKKKINVNN